MVTECISANKYGLDFAHTRTKWSTPHLDCAGAVSTQGNSFISWRTLCIFVFVVQLTVEMTIIKNHLLSTFFYKMTTNYGYYGWWAHACIRIETSAQAQEAGSQDLPVDGKKFVISTTHQQENWSKAHKKWLWRWLHCHWWFMMWQMTIMSKASLVPFLLCR